MLVSIDWIKEFTDLNSNLSPKEISTRFTMATAEVEDVIVVGEFLEKLKVVQIESIKKHPEADKLNLVTFKVNDKETKEVVCGAGNVKEGLKVPYAPLGVTLPNGLTLEPKKIRGILSEGMLCSEEELGLETTIDGLMELESNASIGITMLEYLGEQKDIVLDIDNKSLTHRPDLWGHYGLAREFAAAFDSSLKNPFDNEWVKKLENNFNNNKSPITPIIEKGSAGLCYYGLSVDNVTIGESPAWIKRRLNAVGLRPINNIVDISNYVMMELGIPLHIFDREQISGDKVIIKNVGKKETFITLDEIERPLIETDTVIADADKALVIGGIMGGLNSGVTDKTSKIFIEVANWKSADVRKTSTRLGLRTDSSQRYEKKLDSKLCYRTLLRALDLVLSLCPDAKVVGKPEYDGISLEEIKDITIVTNTKKIESVLGHELSEEKIVNILESLDFKVERNKGLLDVKVPSYRSTKDIECEADLIEEIGRIIGYDNITPSSPLLDVKPVNLSTKSKLHRGIRNFLTFYSNAYEVMTYPMIGEKLLEKAKCPTHSEDTVLLNSLSKDHDRMRPSLVPSILDAVSKNQKNFDDFRIFEIGRSYITLDEEQNHLAIAFYSKNSNVFVDLIDEVEKLLSAMNIPGDLCDKNPKFKNTLIDEAWSGLHPFEFLNIRIMGKMQGVVTSIHPLMLRNFKIKGNLSIAIINLSSFEDKVLKEKNKYKPLPKFPGSDFDWTVVAKSTDQVGNILNAAKKAKIKHLKGISVVDVYKANESENNVTLRANFFDENSTLKGEFLDEAKNILIETLAKAGYDLKS